jgi:hypothetical protein
MAQLPIIDEYIEQMRKHGIIEAMPESEWASNVILVRKAVGTAKFCIDYRFLNSLMHKAVWPLPRIDSCFDSLGGSTYFSTLDMRSGYWQVPMKSRQDMERTSFVTRKERGRSKSAASDSVTQWQGSSSSWTWFWPG